MNEIKEYTEKMFKDIKYIDEKGNYCIDNMSSCDFTYKFVK